MNLYQPCDIVFAPFPYEEGIERTKVRPVLILSRLNERGQYKVAKITTTPRPFEMELPANEETGLQVTSWLDMNQTAYIFETDIICKTGAFPESLRADFKEYLQKLRTYKSR